MTTDADKEGVPPEEIIARLLGSTVEEMRENPEAVRARLNALFGELMKPGAQTVGRPEPEAVREFVRRIRQELRARGVETPEELDDLPDRLQEFYARLQATTPDEVAEHLRAIASLIESPGEQNLDLDDVAAWLETNLGPLVGLTQARRRREARLQVEYRNAAKRSIASSLRKFGIEPLSDVDESQAAPAEMNRQRLFWKEFAVAAAEIRQMLADGQDKEARERVADMLDAFDLNFDFDLSLEGDDAVLTFPPPDNLETATRLQLVIRDSPKLPGWRIMRGRRHGASSPG
jgi:hypothetical protein